MVSDFLLYWIHRGFHGAQLWKYHAVHHSSEDSTGFRRRGFIRSISSSAPSLVDVALLLAGISPNVMLWVGPFTTAHSAFVHANLNWTLGPFKYVLAGPVFHRWHHTAADRGGNKNFAGTFPIWDLMFGTFYMPENELPDAYGIDDQSFPESFGAPDAVPVPAADGRIAAATRGRALCTSFTNLQSTRRCSPPAVVAAGSVVCA